MKKHTNIQDLINRIERLETTNDATERNFSLIRELINIVQEIPIGRLIIRRAENKQRLFNLKNNILPRRQKQLLEIIDMSDIPKPIKQTFINDELKLINSTTRAIIHRENYEQQATLGVKSLLANSKLLNKKEISHASNQ